MGIGRQFVPGYVEDNPQRPPSTTGRMATWVAEFYNRSHEESRRPPGTDTTKATNRPTSVPILQLPSHEARGRAERLEAALKVLGEDIPEAQPLKEALKKAQDQCSVLLVGERLDSTLKSRDLRRGYASGVGSRKTLMQQVLLSQERLRDEAANSVSEPPHNSRPPQAQMEVDDPEEEIRRLRAQVAELHQERAAEHETGESRGLGFSFTPCVGFGPTAFWSSSASRICVQNLINAADSTLKEVRNA